MMYFNSFLFSSSPSSLCHLFTLAIQAIRSLYRSFQRR
jgi:hypothetical protein